MQAASQASRLARQQAQAKRERNNVNTGTGANIASRRRRSGRASLWLTALAVVVGLIAMLWLMIKTSS
jgi:type VI protein secretion system component VasF